MYGTKEGIERLIGDIVSGRNFSTSTVPTISQVEAELVNVAAEIDLALDSVGYTVPINEDDYPHAYAFVKAANEYGAAARVLSMIPTEAYDPDEQMQDIGQTRAQMYERHLKQALKQIWELKIRAGRSRSRFEHLRSSTPDAIYKRGMLEIDQQNGDSEDSE